LDLVFGGRLIGRIISIGPEKIALQSQKFIKSRQFNHLHRQKHRIIDSNPRADTWSSYGSFSGAISWAITMLSSSSSSKKWPRLIGR